MMTSKEIEKKTLKKMETQFSKMYEIQHKTVLKSEFYSDTGLLK